MRKNVAFGASTLGEKFLFYQYKEIKIECFFDNYRYGEICGYKIKKPYYDEAYFIIVTTDRYLEVRKQLIHLGYEEFRDFIPYQMYKKKMAIIYGNCHMRAVKQYLETNTEFNKQYGIYPFPMIQEIPANFEYDKILPHCDLFLHQAIRIENIYGEEFSSENFIRYISDKCRFVALPNLYGMPKCFFPQIDLSVRRNVRDGFQYTIGRDKNIVQWINQNVSLIEIKKYIKDCGGVYEKKDILLLWTQFKEKLLDREKEWDVKISDYIFANYKDDKLFYDPNHISDVLVREIAIRTLKVLGYNGEVEDRCPLLLDTWETYIYKDVMDALELRFDQNHLRRCIRKISLNGKATDSDEYIENLYKWEMFCNER